MIIPDGQESSVGAAYLRKTICKDPDTGSLRRYGREYAADLPEKLVIQAVGGRADGLYILSTVC